MNILVDPAPQHVLGESISFLFPPWFFWCAPKSVGICSLISRMYRKKSILEKAEVEVGRTALIGKALFHEGVAKSYPQEEDEEEEQKKEEEEEEKEEEEDKEEK